jgi:hypothetical protein
MAFSPALVAVFFILMILLNGVLQLIDFKVKLTLSLNFFVDFIMHLEYGQVKNGHKKPATLNILKTEHNKESGWCLNDPRTKITEEVDVPVRKVIDRMLRQYR